MRLRVQFSGPRTIVSRGLEVEGWKQSSAGFARWGWDWLAPDLSLYPIVSAYVVMGRARTPERQNASAPPVCPRVGEARIPAWLLSVSPPLLDVLVNEFSYVLVYSPSLHDRLSSWEKSPPSLPPSPSFRSRSIHRFLACFTCWDTGRGRWLFERIERVRVTKNVQIWPKV